MWGWLAALCVLVLGGCSTPYQSMGFTGGVEAEQMTASTYRIVARHRGYPVGVWSVIGGRMCFRNMAVWEVLHTSSDAAAAHAITLTMAQSNYWGA